jgi:hypothetical protein
MESNENGGGFPYPGNTPGEIDARERLALLTGATMDIITEFAWRASQKAHADHDTIAAEELCRKMENRQVIVNR